MATALLYPQDCLAPSWSHWNRRFARGSDDEKEKPAPVLEDTEVGFCERRSLRERVGVRGISFRNNPSAGLLPLPGHVSPSFDSCRSTSSNLQASRGIPTQRSLPYPQKRCWLPASSSDRPPFLTDRSLFASRGLISDDWLGCRCPGDMRAATPQVSQEVTAVSVCGASSPRSSISLSSEANFGHPSNSPLFKWCGREHKVSVHPETFKKPIPLSLMKGSGDRAETQRRLSSDGSKSTSAGEGGNGQHGPHSPVSKPRQVCDRQFCPGMLINSEGIRKWRMPPPVVEFAASGAGGIVGIANRSSPPAVDTVPLQRSVLATSTENASTSCISSRTENNYFLIPGSVNSDPKSDAVEDSEQSHLKTGYCVDFVQPHPNGGPRENSSHQKVYSRSKSDCCSWTFRANDGHGRLNPACHLDCWITAVDERWAGPCFFNSPHPSSLPVPSFAPKLSRSCSSVESVNDEISSLNGSLLQSKQSGDVTFATNHLRRKLHLDHLCL